MPPVISGALQRVKGTVAGFSVAQRTIAIIGVAVLALGVFALTSWLTRPTLTPLFSGLSASDANAVVEQLRSASVPYELSDGGATVLVPQEDVYDQRLVASAAGLPSASSDGYSLLDEMGVTASEFQQSVTYKRAIEGELATTIASMSGINAASVQLAIPEESVFVSTTIDPTASVFVETREGTTLTSKQVQAIVHLTSAAVSGMKSDNVAVIDQAGNTLSAVGAEAAGGVDQQASDYETRVASSVQEMLDTVVGTGNATVTVVAEIDRSVSERLDETYTPAVGTPPSSEQTRTETQNGGSSNAGVLGPDNIAVPSDGKGATFESTEATRNNVINKATESRTTPAGSVKRQSVSVAVDDAAAGAVNVAQLQALVSAAAGIDAERGDVVAVEFVPFGQTDAEAARTALQAAKDAEDAERNAAILRTVIVALAIAVPLLVGVIALIVRARRRSGPAAEFEQLFGERAPSVSAYAAGQPAAQLEPSPTVPLTLDAPATAATAVLELELEPEPAQATLQRRRAELDALTRSDPKHTAELLRSLIDDRQPA